MKRAENRLPEAMLFETLRASHKFDPNGKPYYTQDVFAIAGKSGFWRRIPREGGLFPTDRPSGVVVAIWATTVVHLVRDLAAEKELSEAGFGLGVSAGEIKWDGPGGNGKGLENRLDGGVFPVMTIGDAGAGSEVCATALTTPASVFEQGALASEAAASCRLDGETLPVDQTKEDQPQEQPRRSRPRRKTPADEMVGKNA